MQKVKSATAAGLLGIFLGQYGAHDWYLGKKVKGIIHVVLAVISLILVIIAVAVTANMNEFRLAVYGMPAYLVIMYIISYLILFGNAVWGFIDGIILLAKGDAGLQAQGYTTALGEGKQQATGNKPTVAKPSAAKSSDIKPAAKTLDPKTKKNIILWTCVGLGIFVILSIVAIVVSLVFRVDYGASYRAANEVKEELSDLSSNSNACDRVVNYVDSSWTTEKSYNEYVSKCLDSLDHDDSTIVELGKTSGVKHDKEIKSQYDKFKGLYDEAFPDKDKTTETIQIYKAWHTFVIKASSASNSNSDDEAYRKAAAVLKDSGNDTLVEYGEGWLELALAYSQAYRSYMGNSKAGSAERNAMYDARTKFRNYVNENEPDIKDIAELKTGSISDVYSAFNKLYSMISDKYEDNYDDSGDCVRLYDAVYCD